MRGKVKKILGPLKDKKEMMELMLKTVPFNECTTLVKTDNKKLLNELMEECQHSWDNLKKMHSKIKAEYLRADIKSNAIKLISNTFYGEAGNRKTSPIFMLQMAAGVTSAGQANLRMVKEFVESNGFIVKYGDTDSLYIMPPAHYFRECDENYVYGKIDVR
jgi:DNA polymerase elongation subunit (family B)